MSSELTLIITLLSDASPGIGVAAGAAIDRDVPHTAQGLPYLPGRRIKGLLREAAVDVAEAGLAPTGVSVDEVFGTGERAGMLVVGNAELQGARETTAWLVWARAMSMAASQRAGAELDVLNADRVVQHFTYTRQQTAIDRESGSARDHTLRRVRVLKRGLLFGSTLQLDDLDDPRHGPAVELLALSALAVRRLGVSRHRGLGRVRCSLFEASSDLSKLAVAATKLRVLV